MRTRQRADPLHHAEVRLGVVPVKLIEQGGGNLAVDFAQQHLGEEPATHADAAMNAPHGKLDRGGVQRLLPGRNVLVDAVDQSSVQVKEEADVALGHAVLQSSGIRPGHRAVPTSMSQRQRAGARPTGRRLSGSRAARQAPPHGGARVTPRG